MVRSGQAKVASSTSRSSGGRCENSHHRKTSTPIPGPTRDPELHPQLGRAGYLGFCEPHPDDHSDLVTANLGAVWRNYAQHGIRYLVVSGILVSAEHRQQVAATLSECSLTTVLLQAEPNTIRARILRRRQVEAAEQQTRLSDPVLRELYDYGDRSARFAALLESGGFADLHIKTDDATPTQIAAQALDRLLSSGA